jgi:hypothetical protein
MNDTKFLELLNLYLDHQISDDEAAQLEVEIRRNPARHQLYRQYCRMQKACALLAEKSRAVAPAQVKVVPLTGHRRFIAAYYTAGLAAAACVAFFVLSRPDATVNNSAAGAPLVLDPAPTLARSSAPDLTVKPEELRTVFSTQALAQLEGATDGAAAFTAAWPSRFDWMNQVQLNPVQVEPMVFRSTQDEPVDRHTFRSHRPFQTTVEMSAFQYQK